MKKKISSVLALILSLAILFCVFATTVSFAAYELVGGTVVDEEVDTSSGSLNTGLFDIKYYDHDVVITLYPTADNLLDVQKSDVEEIFNALFEAFKKVAVEDIKNEFLNYGKEPVTYSLRAAPQTLTQDYYRYLWHAGLENHIKELYADESGSLESAYINFIDRALESETVNGEGVSENAVIDELVTYVCDLLETAVKLDIIDREELPNSENTEELQGITEEIVDVFNSKFHPSYGDAGEKEGEYAEKVEQLLQDRGEDNSHLDTLISNSAEKIVGNYTERAEELQAATEEELVPTVDEIVAHIDEIVIGGETIFTHKKGVKFFSTEGIQALLSSLPRPEEIRNMTDDEMKLEYLCYIHTDYGSSEFGVTLALGAQQDNVRAIAGLIADHVTFTNVGGVVTVKVNMPEKFAELVLEAAKSPSLSNELKHKIFDMLTYSGNDFVDFYEQLTFEDVKELVGAIDFEALFNSDFVKNYIDLSNLTNEQIEEKVESFKNAFEKLLPYGKKLFDLVPDTLMTENISELYKGDGEFAVHRDVEITYDEIDTLLTKLLGKYGPTVAAWLDFEDSIELTLDLSVSFAEIYRVEYRFEGVKEAHAIGFLPAGADLAYFADVTLTPAGKEITAWADENGNELTLMPSRDVVLTAVVAQTPPPPPEYEITITTGPNVDKTFDYWGSWVWVGVNGAPDGAEISYSWTKDGVVMPGYETISAFQAYHVSDSGIYVCTVTVNGTEYVSSPITVNIAKLIIDVSGYEWNYTRAFTYDGTEKSVSLNSVSSHLTAYYTGNKATDAGTYTATVELYSPSIEEGDVGITGSFVTSLEWVINKADYDMSGVEFKDSTVLYDGLPHGIRIEGQLPEGVEVDGYTEDKVAVGVYTMTVSFKIAEDNLNYNCPVSMSATLTILKNNVNTFFYYDTNGTPVIRIDAVEGIPFDREFVVNDVSGAYPSVTLPDGKYYKTYGVYDIFFAKDGVVYPASDDFTVKMLVPEGIRDKADLNIIYIDDDGQHELIEPERDGDYLVFKTTHFSKYAIAEEATAPVPPVKTDYSWIWYLVIALAALLIIALVVIIIIKKRRRGNGDEPTEPNAAPIAPALEAPVEEAPTEEAPTEEAPAEEAPIEEAPAPVPVTVLEAVDGDSIVLASGEVIHVRYRSSFKSRLIQSETDIQDYYGQIKNALMSYKGVKARASWNYESFNKGRVQCAKVNLKGKTLIVYLNLNPANYNVNKYHFTDVSDKPKLDQVPMMMKIRSERALRYTLELIEIMMAVLGIEKGTVQNVDYRMPYESTDALVKSGLVKLILPTGVTVDENAMFVKANVGELLSDYEKESALEANEEAVEEDTKSLVVDGETVYVRYRKSFEARLIQSDNVAKKYYTAIKNRLLSYTGVKARTSWRYESFNKGRAQCAKINVRGKTLVVYLALTPADFNVNKYHFTDVSEKVTFAKVPLMMKVRSDRALRYTLELIDTVMAGHGLASANIDAVDYFKPYESTDELVERGLIKLVLPRGMQLDENSNIVSVPLSELFDGANKPKEVTADDGAIETTPEGYIHTDAEHADVLVTDDEAEARIEHIHFDTGSHTGRMDTINLDTICENFEDGDTVTIEALKEKKLISDNAGRIKVLARGIMTKRLCIIAHKYSLQAVKLITLAGGHAELED